MTFLGLLRNADVFVLFLVFAEKLVRTALGLYNVLALFIDTSARFMEAQDLIGKAKTELADLDAEQSRLIRDHPCVLLGGDDVSMAGPWSPRECASNVREAAVDTAEMAKWVADQEHAMAGLQVLLSTLESQLFNSSFALVVYCLFLVGLFRQSRPLLYVPAIATIGHFVLANYEDRYNDWERERYTYFARSYGLSSPLHVYLLVHAALLILIFYVDAKIINFNYVMSPETQRILERRRAREKRKEEKAAQRNMKRSAARELSKQQARVSPAWFFHSCLYGHKDAVKVILNSFMVDINERLNVPCPEPQNVNYSFNGNTGLHLAASKGHLAVVQVLLENSHQKADLYARNDDDQTPMDLAIASGHYEVLKRMLSCKRFKWARANLEGMVLVAVVNHQFEIARRLLSEQPGFKFRVPNFKPMVERCEQLSRELSKMGPRHPRRPVKERDLNSYVEHLSKTYAESDKNGADDRNGRENETEEDYANAAPEDVLSLFECPICFEDMLEGQIRACTNDHWLCGRCLDDHGVDSCPICREDFDLVPPTRRYTGEQIAKIIRSVQKAAAETAERYVKALQAAGHSYAAEIKAI